jgi:hypothetical protein
VRELDYEADISAKGDGYELLTWIFAAAMGGQEIPDPTSFKVRILVDGKDIPVGDVIRAMLQSQGVDVRPLVLCLQNEILGRGRAWDFSGDGVGTPAAQAKRAERVDKAARKFCETASRDLPGVRGGAMLRALVGVLAAAELASSVVHAASALAPPLGTVTEEAA